MEALKQDYLDPLHGRILYTKPRNVGNSSGSSIKIEVDHGTTTLGFKFKGGIIIAVDSRATGGMFIGISITLWGSCILLDFGVNVNISRLSKCEESN